MRRIPIAKTFGSAPASLARSPAPAFTVSNAPTTFYRQHHVVEAPAIDEREFRPAWRIKTRLMLLLECDRIDRRQLEAAAAFKHWCEVIGRPRTSAWLAVRVDGGRRPDGLITISQIEAAQQLAVAVLALGRKRIKLLHWTLVDDLPWTETSKRIGMSKKTTTCRVVEAIAALALWRAGEPVPPAPVTRLRIEPGRW